MESLDALRMNRFRFSTDNSFRTVPPSRDGLTEHIKHACLHDGYEWRTPVAHVDFTDTTHWGWRFIDNKYISKCYSSSDTLAVNYLTQVCSRKKGLCKNCNCPKNKVNSLSYCGCNRKCRANYYF